MANTVKTLTGEILISEVEAVVLDQTIAAIPKLGPIGKVVIVGKTGVKYDITGPLQVALAAKVLAATTAFVAGSGHNVFDPTQVK